MGSLDILIIVIVIIGSIATTLSLLLIIYDVIKSYNYRKSLDTNFKHEYLFNPEDELWLKNLEEKVENEKLNITREEWKKLAKIVDYKVYPLVDRKNDMWYYMPLDIPINIIDRGVE